MRFSLEISQQINMQLANKFTHELIVSKTYVHNNEAYLINSLPIYFMLNFYNLENLLPSKISYNY